MRACRKKWPLYDTVQECCHYRDEMMSCCPHTDDEGTVGAVPALCQSFRFQLPPGTPLARGPDLREIIGRERA